MTVIRVIDAETTGTEETDEVVEIGFYDIAEGAIDLLSRKSFFVRPSRSIPAQASAIHHITDGDVATAKTWPDVVPVAFDTKGAYQIGIFAAHVASFERRWIDPVKALPWICTWKSSLRQWPELESHSLQSIRYSLKLEVNAERSNPPHRSAPDAYVCAVLVVELLKHQTIETLIQWSSEPPLFTKFDFGQFKGKPLSAADDGYMVWLAEKDHVMGDDWRWNARRELDRRNATKRDARIKKWVDGVRSAATVGDLNNWWAAEEATFMAERIVPGSDEYEILVGEARARKALILASPGPVFDPSEAPK